MWFPVLPEKTRKEDMQLSPDSNGDLRGLSRHSRSTHSFALNSSAREEEGKGVDGKGMEGPSPAENLHSLAMNPAFRLAPGDSKERGSSFPA